MGCVSSKLEEEEEVISICRERKRLLKLAVERRYGLAEAHSRYCQALYALGAAIKLFVARHSSPSSRFLIAFPPPSSSSPPPSETVISNPMFLQQKPSEPTKETIPCESSDGYLTSTRSSEEVPREEQEEEEEETIEREEQVCGYFYMQMPPPMPSPQRDFGWDFFNPFSAVRPEVINGYNQCSDEDLRAVREQEGIPDLEEEGDRREEEKNVVMVEETVSRDHGKEGKVEIMSTVDGANVNQEEKKGLTVVDIPVKGRELLEALSDIEYHFNTAYESGKDVSRMLEANRVHPQSGFGEIKENSTKLIQAITWHRSTSSRSSSCKSIVASGPKTSEWKECANELFEDCGGMDSGSHSLTLGRLYAWEKKLYEEVKAGDRTRKVYERKCSRLRKHDVRGDDALNMDKTRVAVKDLYARILVAVRSAESISERIEKLRDEELQPQIMELLQGYTSLTHIEQPRGHSTLDGIVWLMNTWKTMLEAHETQNKILSEVKTFMCPTFGKFCNNSHRLATLQLEAELQNWRACFTNYVASQKLYIEALHGWLSKFLVPEVEFCSRGRSSAPPCRTSGPPLLMICHEWLTSLEKLPENSVSCAMKSFTKDVRALWVQQGEEQQQKRKVDTLVNELDRRVFRSQKGSENKIVEFTPSLEKLDLDSQLPEEYLTDKDMVDVYRRKLILVKEKHHFCMQETHRITLGGFQTGFSAVLESLTDFSKASLDMYNNLVSYSQNAERCVEGGGGK